MRRALLVTGAAATVLLVAGCGTKVNHDSPQPTEDIRTQQWVRIETPPAFATMMFTCVGTTGIYMDQGDGNMQAFANDPLCPISRVFDPVIQAKYGFKIVVRTNGQSAGESLWLKTLPGSRSGSMGPTRTLGDATV